MSGTRKLARLGLELEPGWIYFLDAQGDVGRARLQGARMSRPTKVSRVGIAREPGFLYFVDADGDVACVPLSV